MTTIREKHQEMVFLLEPLIGLKDGIGSAGREVLDVRSVRESLRTHSLRSGLPGRYCQLPDELEPAAGIRVLIVPDENDDVGLHSPPLGNLDPRALLPDGAVPGIGDPDPPLPRRSLDDHLVALVLVLLGGILDHGPPRVQTDVVVLVSTVLVKPEPGLEPGHPILADRIPGRPPALGAQVLACVPALEEALVLVVENGSGLPGPGLKRIPFGDIAEREDGIGHMLGCRQDPLHDVLPGIECFQVEEQRATAGGGARVHALRRRIGAAGIGGREGERRGKPQEVTAMDGGLWRHELPREE